MVCQGPFLLESEGHETALRRLGKKESAVVYQVRTQKWEKPLQVRWREPHRVLAFSFENPQ